MLPYDVPRIRPFASGSWSLSSSPTRSGIDASRRWRRHIYKVDFLVDGRVLWTDHKWPFSFRSHTGWDTRTVADGRHMLVVRASGRHGYRSRKVVPVRVDNPPMRLALDGVSEGAALAGIATVGWFENADGTWKPLLATGCCAGGSGDQTGSRASSDPASRAARLRSPVLSDSALTPGPRPGCVAVRTG